MNNELEEKLAECMPKLAELFIGVALGEKSFTGGKTQEAAATRIWDTLSPLIKRISESRVMDAGNTSDVISMLKDGKISLADAKDLMAILNIKTDIEEVGALQKQIDALTSEQETPL